MHDKLVCMYGCMYNFCVLLNILTHTACSTTDRPIMFVNDMGNGYPRICRNGLWQYVCNRDMSWGASQANSVCQIANFGSGEIRKCLLGGIECILTAVKSSCRNGASITKWEAIPGWHQ